MAALLLRFACRLALAVGLSRAQGAAREFLDTGEERLGACRAAGARAGADRLDQGGILARPPEATSPRWAAVLSATPLPRMQ